MPSHMPLFPDAHLAAQPTKPPHCSLQLRLTKIEGGSTATPNSPRLEAVLKRLQVRRACHSAGVCDACSACSVRSHHSKQATNSCRAGLVRQICAGACCMLLDFAQTMLTSVLTGVSNSGMPHRPSLVVQASLPLETLKEDDTVGRR